MVRPVILLPGMDGTGVSFRHFVAHAPADITPVIVALPSEPFAYRDVSDYLASTLEFSPAAA